MKTELNFSFRWPWQKEPDQTPFFMLTKLWINEDGEVEFGKVLLTIWFPYKRPTFN